MDNFRITKAYGVKGLSKLKTGHKTQFELLVKRAQEGGEPLIPFDEIINVTKASFTAIESLKKSDWVSV